MSFLLLGGTLWRLEARGFGGGGPGEGRLLQGFWGSKGVVLQWLTILSLGYFLHMHIYYICIHVLQYVYASMYCKATPHSCSHCLDWVGFRAQSFA